MPVLAARARHRAGARVPHGITANAIYLAYALILFEPPEPGLEALVRAIQNPIACMPQWTRYATVTASAFLAAGRTVEAANEVEKGLTLATERHARGYRAPLLRLSPKS